jgi:MIP family channel proteins
MADKDWTFKQLAAEFMAMILFVWIGTGAAVSSNFFTEGGGVDPARLLTIAMAFGIGITVLAYGIGHISGGHINPAVTFAFMLLRKQSPVAGILYMVSQFAGAVVGSFIVWGCSIGLTNGCPDDETMGVCAGSSLGDGSFGPAYMLGVNQVNSRINLGSAFLLELMGTYLLVITVLNSAVHVKSTAGNCAPLAIGFSVLLAHILLIPFTGCGINPARSFGPMIVDSIGGYSSMVWIRGVWVYYTAPFVGAGLAATTYEFVFQECEGDSAEAAAPAKEEVEESA